MSAVPKPRLTPAEYLAIERQAETKSEYFNGQVFAMAGASRKHNLIAGNAYAGLHHQLEDRPCEAYQGDMRVKVAETGLYTYPDVVVVCDEPELEDEYVDTLLNPSVLFEVLSETTERYDRGRKFAHYRRIESLSEYVMISQNEHRVEHYVRQPDKTWALKEYTRLEDVLDLPSIECRLTLKSIYAKVKIEEPENE